MAAVRKVQVFLRGGLGNQLFQYSTGLDLARRNNRELVLRGDLLPKIEDSVGEISRWPNQIVSFEHSGIVRTKSYQPQGRTNLRSKVMQISRVVGDKWPIALEHFGWMAAEKNAHLTPVQGARIRIINSYGMLKDVAWANRRQLRAEITKVLNPSESYLEMIDDIRSEPTTVIHIRQGDYIKLGEVYGNLASDYYIAALKNLTDSGVTSRKWIFTDSIDGIPSEILELIKPHKIISSRDLSRPIENLLVMSSGSEMVAANSTFSWWSCLLGRDDKKIIAPRVHNAKVNIFSLENEPAKHWQVLSA